MGTVFIEESAIRLGAAAAVSAGTDVTGASFDTAGYDGVVIFCTIATANAGNFLKAQQDIVTGFTAAADLAGSRTGTSANGNVAILDINRPKEQFVRGVVVRGGANTATGDMYYIGYYGSSQPVINAITNSISSKSLVSPLEGTA